MTTSPADDDPLALTVTDAYVSASSGIAVGDSTTTAPDQIYVEFSAPVVLDGADGPIPADGFRIDGTTAGVETVWRGQTATEATDDCEGSRVLVLSLSRAITADERVTLSYAPAAGDVRLPDGPAPRPVDDIEVTLGSPRILDAAISVDRANELQLTFDQPVVLYDPPN